MMTYEQIQRYISHFNIKSAVIQTDLSVNIYANVYLNTHLITHIPFKINKVEGIFDISRSALTTLENCPEYVTGRYYCNHNKLTSLKGAPIEVGGGFDCSYNQLQTLDYFPEKIMNTICLDKNPFIRDDEFHKTLMHISESDDYKFCNEYLFLANMTHEEAKAFTSYMEIKRRIDTINNIVNS